MVHNVGMTTTELPFRATTEQACAWLAQETGDQWTLARLIDNAMTPYVWLDYDAAFPELFGDANGGYAAPIFFEDDTRRLAEGSDDVLITITKDAYKIVAKLPPPGFRRPLNDLRFLKSELEKLVKRLKREALPQPVKVEVARESQDGIHREQVIAAFGRLVKFDLDQALTDANGVFGDDGARVKASAKKGKNKAVWNPVTLALGLNDLYRVPMSQLKKAFKSHDFLYDWDAQWTRTLELLGH